MPSPSHSIDVFVIGGGIVGLSSACVMAQMGFDVTLVDGSSLYTDTSERVYALNHASVQLLKQMGAWSLLSDEQLAPYQGMHIWHQDAPSNILQFHAREVAQTCLGYMMKSQDLKPALIERAKALGVHLIENTKIVHCQSTATGFEATDEHQTLWQAKLAMICDGPRSAIREMLGIQVTSCAYAHDALVATVACEKPHQQTAYQVFDSKGPLALLPLKNPHECSIVWSYPPKAIQRLKDSTEDEFNQALTAQCCVLGGLQLKHQRFSYPLVMRHVKQYTGPHWMLLGDSAHTIHPLAGLGLNLGLADLACWAQLLQEQMPLSGIAPLVKPLKTYERTRQFEVWTVIALMQGIKTLFSLQNAPLRFLRSQGMRVFNQLTPMKRELIHFASGVDKL